jgi:hypothetical protein
MFFQAGFTIHSREPQRARPPTGLRNGRRYEYRSFALEMYPATWTAVRQ